jgi:uncharacterized YccA/Bax inhibitor family protein
MATAAEVTSIITEIEQIASEVLTSLSAVDPALGVPAELVTVIGGLATSAINAFQTASGTPITAASVEALLPAPLPAAPPPTS